MVNKDYKKAAVNKPTHNIKSQDKTMNKTISYLNSQEWEDQLMKDYNNGLLG